MHTANTHPGAATPAPPHAKQAQAPSRGVRGLTGIFCTRTCRAQGACDARRRVAAGSNGGRWPPGTHSPPWPRCVGVCTWLLYLATVPGCMHLAAQTWLHDVLIRVATHHHHALSFRQRSMPRSLHNTTHWGLRCAWPSRRPVQGRRRGCLWDLPRSPRQRRRPSERRSATLGARGRSTCRCSPPAERCVCCRVGLCASCRPRRRCQAPGQAACVLCRSALHGPSEACPLELLSTTSAPRQPPGRPSGLGAPPWMGTLPPHTVVHACSCT